MEQTTAPERILDTFRYLIITVATFLVLQALLVVMHEFTHSTMAWALGAMPSPLGIVWGNPLTMTGWDEGVNYTRLFASGRGVSAAIIGVSPLVMHTAIVTLGMVFLQKKGMWQRKWLAHALFWFVVANFMELIAYVLMRAFASHGDVGIFNRGLGLSPWIIFSAGSLALVAGLSFLFRKILPRIYAMFARGNRLYEWCILILTAFLLFVWGSGLRVVLYVYPDPQWMFGLLGFAAFIAVLGPCNPSRAWVIRRTKAELTQGGTAAGNVEPAI